MRYVHRKRILCCVFILVIILNILFILHPSNNACSNYEFIKKKDIINALHMETIPNYFSNTALTDCDYQEIVFDETLLSSDLINEDLVEGHRIREGGEYSPNECNPKISVALIVPYRGNAEQLRAFLVYMHTFLHHQKIHYRIYVMEQVGTKPFNRAMLMNIGALSAIKALFPCLILHDVDLVPMRLANLYACTSCPRHLSSSINKYRFVLPYLNLIEGVIAILSKQYKNINGMSNMYFGQEGENKNFYDRMVAHHLKLCRFELNTSKYYRTQYKTEMERSILRDIPKSNMSFDGLNSLKFEELEVASVLHPLFTHIMVDL